MANVRRVRQDAEAAARRYAEYGNLIASYNVKVDKMNSGNAAAVALYNQQVADFKAFQKEVEEGRAFAVANIGYGNMFGGRDPLEEQKARWPKGMVPALLSPEQEKTAMDERIAEGTYITQKINENYTAWVNSFGPNGPPLDAQPPAYDPSSDPDYPKSTIEQRWVPEDSAEGQKTLMAMNNAGQYAIVAGKDGKIIPGDLDERGGVNDAGYMGTELPAASVLVSQGWGGTANKKENFWLKNGDGTATRYTRSGADKPWVAAGEPIKILAWDKEAPVQQTDAGPVPEEPKAWNPSLRERAELDNPTANAAGANMAAAMGSYAKTGLMNEASRNNQSLTNSDTGVLNRVMQGIL